MCFVPLGFVFSRRFRVSGFGFRASRPGVALLLAVLILAALLAIGLGIFDVVFGEIRITEELSDSFTALYAADQGIERLLYDDLVADALSGCSGNGPCTYGPINVDLGSQRCTRLSLRRTGGGQTTAESIGEYRCGSERSVKRRLVTSYEKAATFGFSPDSTGNLESGLVAYWPLNENSGTREDVRGANNLAEINGTVSAQPGIQDQAARFQAVEQRHLSIGDNPDVSTGDIDFTIAAWVYLDTITDHRTILAKGDTVNGCGDEYLLWYQGTARNFRFEINCQAKQAIAASFGAPVAGTWYFVAAWHDAAAGTVNIQVNNGPVDSTTTAGIAPPDTTHSLRIGMGSDAFANPFDGRIDEVGFWKRVLIAQERTDLYNGGSGNTCAAPCQ